MKKEHRVKAIYFLLLTIAFIFATEWVARRLPFIFQERVGPLFREDPTYVFRMKSNLEALHFSPDAKINLVYHTDSRGFRNGEFLSNPVAGTFRIICLGDSYTFGDGVPDGKTYPQLLHQNLKSSPAQGTYEAINAGQMSWSTGQELRLLESEIFALKPNLVTIGFSVPYNYHALQMNKIMSIQDGNLVRVAVSRNRVHIVRQIMKWIPIYEFLTEHSVLFNHVRRLVLVALQQKDANQEGPTVVEVGKTMDETLALSSMILSDMQRQCHQNNAQLLVLLFISQDMVIDMKDDGKHPYFQFYHHTLNDLKSLKIPYIDFMTQGPAWSRAQGIPIDDIFLPVDEHYSPVGHQMVAEALTDWILKSRN